MRPFQLIETGWTALAHPRPQTLDVRWRTHNAGKNAYGGLRRHSAYLRRTTILLVWVL